MFGTSEDFDGFSDVLNLSGISNTPVRTDLELHALSNKGLGKSVLPLIANQLGLTELMILKALDLDKAQYERMKDNELFSFRTSEHLLKLLELISRGKDLWGKEQNNFKGWIKGRIGALGGNRPVDYLNTFSGIDSVIAIIGRIEHGVYS